MTAKQFDRAMGKLNGTGNIEKLLMGAIGICLIVPAPFASLNYNILSIFWVLFTILFCTLEYIHISYDPAYPVIYKGKANDDEKDLLVSVTENQRTINAAALFPADRETAVRAYQNKRLLISIFITAGLIAQGTALIRSKELIADTPLILGPSFITLFYNIGSILFMTGKGMYNFGVRQLCISCMIAFSLSMLTIYSSDDRSSGLGAGVFMLTNAAITLTVNLITYRKCLHDAKNTARNGEAINGGMTK